ncbi:hypothetical protein [Microbacterium sp. Se5.02b]|nr:hypothetical protein [Microbacterium sp. Se5.02b]
MTITVLDALAELDRELATQEVTLHLAGLPAAAVAVAERTPWFTSLRSAGRVHGSVRDGMDAAAAAPTDASDGAVHPGEVDEAR